MARLLRLKNPNIKVLFTSGYADRTILPPVETIVSHQ
jgi:hypothetical protein